MTFPTAEVTRISNTQIELFSGCPLAWWFRYVLRIRTDPSIYQLLGQSVHESLSDYYKDIIEGFQPMEHTEFLNYTSDKVSGVLYNTSHNAAKFGKSEEEVINSRLYAVDMYMQTIGKTLIPIKSEVSIQKLIPNTDVEFLGIIDLVTKDHVIDFKLCGKPWGPKKVKDSVQPKAYSFLLGRPLDFQFHFISADATPKIMDVHIPLTDATDYINRAGALAMSMKEVASGRQKPTTCTNNCSEHTCDYTKECMMYKYDMHEELLKRIPKEEKTIATIDGTDATELID